MHNHRTPFIIMKLAGHPAGEKSPHGHPGQHSSPAEAMQGRRSPMHCFFLLQSGTVLVEIGSKSYLIKEKELVIVPAGQIFTVKYFENAHGFMGGFSTQFISGTHTAENALSKYDFLRIWGSPKIELSEEEFSRQLHLFNRIYEEYRSLSPQHEIIKAYLAAILTEADIIYKQTLKEVTGHNNSLCNKFLETLFKYAENCEYHLASDYARMLGISPNHLNKVVKCATGKSASAWIDEARILKAKNLLVSTTLPLSEIAARCGIMDQSYFARKFRQHEGISPSEYRQQNIK